MNPRKALGVVVMSLFISTGFGSGCGAINKLMGKSPDKQQAKQGEQKKDDKKEATRIGVVLDPKQEETAQIKKGLSDAAKREDAELVYLQAQELGAQAGDKGQDKGKQDQKGKNDKKQGGQDKQGGKDSKGGGDFKAIIVQGSGEQNPEMFATLAKQKLPIVAIDQAPPAKVEAIVAPDYFRVGEMQGEFVKSKLKEGKVVLLKSSEPSAEEIEAGNKAALAQSQGLQIVQTFASPTKNATPAGALDDYLKKNPGGVQAVIASDSKLAMEAIETLKKSNLNKKVLVVGAGADKKAVAQIASGDLNADVDKSPYLQGFYAYKLASQLSKKQAIDADKTVATEKGQVPAKIVPIQLVRSENLAQYQKLMAQATETETEEQGKEQGGGQKQQGSQSGDKAGGTQTGSQGGQKSGQAAGQQGQGSLSASGAAQVREKIRTEITREMLSADGKVMGTEKEVKEEVRTLPSALVEARQQEAQKGDKKDKQEDKKDKGSKDEKGDKEGDSEEGGQKQE